MSDLPKILIAGIGNIFNADDGFGSEVARHLLKFSLGNHVRVIDFGIRGFDLAFSLLDENYELAILVDTVKRGGEPGTLYVIEPDLKALEKTSAGDASTETHTMHPAKMLAWAQALGGTLPKLRLVGCEPEDLGPGQDEDEDVRVGLTPKVSSAVDEAARMIVQMVGETSGGACTR